MTTIETTDTITTELEIHGAHMTPLSLSLPDSTTFEEWADIGKKLCRAGHVMNWWIADWAAFGETKWPAKQPDNGQPNNDRRHHGALKEFARLNGYADGTIWNAASIARRVETSRRREDLSFGHHEAVASLPPKLQDKWLTEASEKGLPRGALRALIRDAEGRSNAKKPDGIVMKWIQDKPVEGLVTWLKGRPIEFWTEERRHWWKEFLRPLVEIWEAL